MVSFVGLVLKWDEMACMLDGRDGRQKGVDDGYACMHLFGLYLYYCLY